MTTNEKIILNIISSNKDGVRFKAIISDGFRYYTADKIIQILQKNEYIKLIFDKEKMASKYILTEKGKNILKEKD
ncbi:MAG: hypothetical protein ACYCTB_11015 [bacterium]